MHKKMIKTVLDKLPPHIKHYSPEDQVILIEFLNLLKDFEKAEIKRKDLINNYENYNKRLLGTKKYLHTPFLWFTVAYFQKARLTLNWANFQAESFYEYLAKFLRKNPSYYGVFELIRKQTPLNDEKWEQLQYACRKMVKPLSREQMKINEGIISIIKNQGIYALDPRIMKKKLSTNFPKGTKVDKALSAFLTNLESQWYLNYHSPAFGIERVFFHIEGLKARIDEIIHFHDPNNTILGLSDIYISRNQSNEYLGIFYVPTQDVKALTTFIRKHEQRGTFRLKELSKIKTISRKLSLEQYKANEGWPITSKTDLQRITNLLKRDKEEEVTKDNTLTFTTPKFNENWHFNQHQLPIELIKLYSDVNTAYTFSELPSTLLSQKRKNQISKTNIGLLKQLKYNNILSIDWIPWRLVFEYSLDYFWIKIPRNFLEKVNHLLKIIPFSTVFLSDDKFYLWLHLTPQMVNWLKNEFDWEINPISRFLSPQPPNFNWFNQEELRWKTPRVLIHEKE